MEITTNLRAFLDTIAWAEIGPDLLAVSDRGYDVVVGSTVKRPILFRDYSDHPRVYVGGPVNSTAAGCYQILSRYFDHYRRALGLPDFSPTSQDAIAVQLIRECRALPDIEAGLIDSALHRCRSRWTSLPGAGYGQHEHKMAALIAAYRNAGGELA